MMYKIKLKQDSSGYWKHTKNGYYASDLSVGIVLGYAVAVKNIKKRNRNKPYRIVLQHHIHDMYREIEGRHRK